MDTFVLNLEKELRVQFPILTGFPRNVTKNITFPIRLQT